MWRELLFNDNKVSIWKRSYVSWWRNSSLINSSLHWPAGCESPRAGREKTESDRWVLTQTLSVSIDQNKLRQDEFWAKRDSKFLPFIHIRKCTLFLCGQRHLFPGSISPPDTGNGRTDESGGAAETWYSNVRPIPQLVISNWDVKASASSGRTEVSALWAAARRAGRSHSIDFSKKKMSHLETGCLSH